MENRSSCDPITHVQKKKKKHERPKALPLFHMYIIFIMLPKQGDVVIKIIINQHLTSKSYTIKNNGGGGTWDGSVFKTTYCQA